MPDSRPEPGPAELRAIVRDIAERFATEPERGAVARYIPQLAHVDPGRFGVMLITADGQEIGGGDVDVAFSIQSISKVFALTLALGREGEALWRRVGREPSGDPFNSIVQLEYEKGVPRNPFINAGAIAVTDALLSRHAPAETIGQMLRFLRHVSDDDAIAIDPAVARSETETGYRNVALANFMRAYGALENRPDRVLGVYFHHCAIAMTCRQLARAGRYLAWDGALGPGGARVTTAQTARRINALMLTCGHYDGSGEFAFRVGLPGKSGVGGGILAVAPGRASIACWSPGLNAVGNSLLATRALEELARATGWSVFAGR